MNQPSVFISCVSPEFRQTRSRVAAILTRLGYTPVIQEIFGTEPGDLRQVLRDKIDACEGLIQIVGQGYGAEPPEADAGYGRVSYTQFEFLYAREKKKKTWLIFAGDACTRNTPQERLDLPNDLAHPDPVDYQAERRTLQLTYRNKRRNDGHLYYDATSDTDLELKVERLRDDLAELRRASEAWQKKLLAGQEELLSRSAITTEKIRAHLLESVERTHQVALAEAENAKGWRERERLRRAAEEAHVSRLSRIDDLAASFAEIEGTGRATQVFDEMTRILAEEGVDQALAYVATQRSSILQKVMARAATAREKNRADLLPLLKSAQLEANRNQPAEAERHFAEILDLEPDWPDALDAQLWFHIIQGNHAFHHTTLAEAFGHFQAAETTVQRLLKAEPDAPRSRRDLSASYERIGDVQRAQGNPPSALSSYKQGLEIREKLAAHDPANTNRQRDLSVSYERIGDVQRAQGDLPSALSSYKQGLEIAQKLAARDPTNTEWQRDLSVSHEKIGNVQSAQSDLKAALSSYQKGLEIRENLAAGDQTNTEWQRDLSVSHNKIGDVQSDQGDPPSALTSYKQCLEIAQKLAARDPANTEWQRDLSASYERIGDVQRAQGDLPSAISSYTQCLEIAQKLAARAPANAQWKTNLVISLWKLASILEQQGTPQKRAAGVNYQLALELLRSLAVENRLTAEQKTWISQLEVRLKAITKEPPRGPNDN